MKLNFSQMAVGEAQRPVLMFLWSLWFLLFDASNSSKSYELFSNVPAFMWAVLFTFDGIVRALAITRGGFFLNAFAALFSGSLWGVSCVLFGLANFSSHAVPVTFYFTMINFLRLREVIKASKT